MSQLWIQTPRPGGIARARVRSAADVREIERTPYEELLPSWSIIGMLEHVAALTPSKVAIVVADAKDASRAAERISYATLTALVRATANRLRAVSGDAHPVVSILTPLVPEAFIAHWAGATAGSANPINPYLRFDHVAEIMNAAGTTVLVCGGRAQGSAAWDRVEELRARVPTLRAIWFTDDAAGEDSFRRQISHAEHDRLLFEPERSPDRTAAMLHTGGTTSTPKLVRHTERGELLNAWCCGAYIGGAADAVSAVGMPYFHVSGSIVLALSSVALGQTMVLVSPGGYRDGRVIEGFWDVMLAHGVTQTVFTPTTGAALLSAYRGQRVPEHFGCWSGGSAVPLQVSREFASRIGIVLGEGWGMTELQGGLIVNPVGSEPRLGSIGIAFPYHRVRCVASGSRSVDDVVAEGQVGVLAVSGPCVTPGYSDPKRNHELFFEGGEASERWLNTGDLCTIDADGYVWLRGRSKDLIIRGGHNIDPAIIEDALLTHPAVMLAAAIGEPDRDKGEMPVAYVQLRPGATAGEPELLAHCLREVSERAAAPRAVHILEAMPVTAVGKIFKPALRLDAIRRCIVATQQRIEGAQAVPIDVRDEGGTVVAVLSADAASRDAAGRLLQELQHYTFRARIE